MLEFAQQNEIQIVFIVCALMGGVMHYLKKFLKGETETKIYEWYGKENIAATVYTVTVFFFAIIGAIAADVVNSQTGFWAAMYSGFVTGFAIDAGFNGDARNMSSDLANTKSDLNRLFTQPGVPGAKAPVSAEPQPTVTEDQKPVVTDTSSSTGTKRPVYRPKPLAASGQGD